MNLAELVWAAAIVAVIAIVGGTDPIKEPYRVAVCLVASGPDAEDVSTNIWSDQIEAYFERYPGSYCGSCGKAVKCP